MKSAELIPPTLDRLYWVHWPICKWEWTVRGSNTASCLSRLWWQKFWAVLSSWRAAWTEFSMFLIGRKNWANAPPSWWRGPTPSPPSSRSRPTRMSRSDKSFDCSNNSNARLRSAAPCSLSFGTGPSWSPLPLNRSKTKVVQAWVRFRCSRFGRALLGQVWHRIRRASDDVYKTFFASTTEWSDN